MSDGDRGGGSSEISVETSLVELEPLGSIFTCAAAQLHSSSDLPTRAEGRTETRVDACPGYHLMPLILW